MKLRFFNHTLVRIQPRAPVAIIIPAENLVMPRNALANDNRVVAKARTQSWISKDPRRNHEDHGPNCRWAGQRESHETNPARELTKSVGRQGQRENDDNRRNCHTENANREFLMKGI